MKYTSFTNHAFERVKERLHLSLEEVRLILDDPEKHIPIRKEPSSNRVHLIFYSPIDRNYFVAVRDEKTRQVITLMPYHYGGYNETYENALTYLAASSEGRPLSQLLKLPETTALKPAYVPFIRLKFVFINSKKIIRINTLEIPIDKLPCSPDDLEKDLNFYKEVKRLVSENLLEDEEVHKIYLQASIHKKFQIFDSWWEGKV